MVEHAWRNDKCITHFVGKPEGKRRLDGRSLEDITHDVD